jgi:hypothetical protein
MAACAVLWLSGLAAAENPGEHPAYLHGLSDLRQARNMLNVETHDVRVDNDERLAISEIDAAIHDVKEAAIDDGKNLAERPPVDARGDRTDRLRRVLELLDGAHHDIDKDEHDRAAKELKHRALHHIDEARKAIHHAMDAERHE